MRLQIVRLTNCQVTKLLVTKLLVTNNPPILTIHIYSACLSHCLDCSYPTNIKTAKPIRPKFLSYLKENHLSQILISELIYKSVD